MREPVNFHGDTRLTDDVPLRPPPSAQGIPDLPKFPVDLR